jgi:TolB protein
MRSDTLPLCGRRRRLRAGGRRRAASALLILGLAVSACGQASTGGGEIAFTSDADGDVEVYAMHADGSGVHQVTDRPGEDSFPAWSPDGTSIAFYSSSSGSEPDVYVIAADGSRLRRLTDDPASDADPDWSPDGSRILFSSRRDGQLAIWVMDADGSNVRRLTRDRSTSYCRLGHPMARVSPSSATSVGHSMSM